MKKRIGFVSMLMVASVLLGCASDPKSSEVEFPVYVDPDEARRYLGLREGTDKMSFWVTNSGGWQGSFHRIDVFKDSQRNETLSSFIFNPKSLGSNHTTSYNLLDCDGSYTPNNVKKMYATVYGFRGSYGIPVDPTTITNFGVVGQATFDGTCANIGSVSVSF